MARYFSGATTNGLTTSFDFNSLTACVSGFTVATWINRANLNDSTRAIVATAQVGGIAWYYAGQQCIVDRSLAVNVFSTPGRLVPGWNHVAYSYSGQNFSDIHNYYVNGFLVFTTGTGTNAYANTGQTYKIFNRADNSLPFFGSGMDFSYWLGVLSLGEIASLGTARARPKNIRPSSLQMWLPLNGSGATTEIDYSGNGNNVTVVVGGLAPDPPQLNSPISIVTIPHKGPGSASFNPYWAIGRNQFIEGFAS